MRRILAVLLLLCLPIAVSAQSIPGTSGLTIVPPPGGGGGGGGTGCVPSGGSPTNIVLYGAAGACNPALDANITNGALTLGLANTTIGSLILEGSSSGAATITGGTNGTFTSASPWALSGLVTLTGASNALGTPLTLVLTNATGLPLTTGVTGILPVPNGGTGAATLTAAGLILGHGTSAFTALAEVDGDCVVGAAGAWTAASCPGGGSSWNLTDGTTSLTGVTNLTVPGGTLKVGGTPSAATLTPIVTDVNHAGSFSSWNIGGQDFMSVTGTATLPTLTVGGSFMLVTGSGATATLTVPGGVTLAGAVSQSTLGSLSFLACAYFSATEYDCATASNSGGSGITQLTGDVTAGPGSGSQAATLANTAVTAGTYGDATHVAQVTFDAKGRATGASNVAITGGGSGAVTLISTLTANNTATSLTWNSLTGNEYIIRCTNIVGNTSGDSLEIQYLESGTPKTTGYNYNTAYVTGGSTGNPLNNQAGFIFGSGSTSGTFNFHGLSLSGTGANKPMDSVFFGNQAGTLFVSYFGGNYTADANAVTGIRVFDPSGNLGTGSCSLYAVAS